MKKLITLLSLSLLFIFFQNFSYSNRPWYQNKKGAGVSVWLENDPTGRNHNIYIDNAYKQLKLLNSQWFYTWTTRPLKRSTNDDNFYPMIWSYDTTKKMPVNRGILTMQNQIEDIELLRKERNISQFKRILMFNESDNEGQNFVTPWMAANQIRNHLTTAENNRIPALNTLAEIIVPPVMTHTPINGSYGETWLDEFFRFLPFANFMRESDDKRVIPLHIYLDPFNLGFASHANDFNDPVKRDQILKSLLEKFISEVHQVKRKYKARIMITEFGIADWAAKGVAENSFNNRIPASFIAEFYRYLLPELYLRDYISHFVLFSNSVGGRSTKEPLASNAAFRRDQNYDNGNPNTSGQLTEVGRVYAQAQFLGHCQKGEFVDGNENIVEFFHLDCGAPTEFGWTGSSNKNANNGWFIQSNQYRRVLTKEQAGYYAYNTEPRCNRGRIYDRNRGEIIEYRTPRANCGSRPTSSGWFDTTINGVQQYRRIFNITRDQVGVIQFPKYNPMVMNSNRSIAGDQIKVTRCERSYFVWQNIRYEQACGCFDESTNYRPVNDRGSQGQTCFHAALGLAN